MQQSSCFVFCCSQCRMYVIVEICSSRSKKIYPLSRFSFNHTHQHLNYFPHNISPWNRYIKFNSIFRVILINNSFIYLKYYNYKIMSDGSRLLLWKMLSDQTRTTMLDYRSHVWQLETFDVCNKCLFVDLFGLINYYVCTL